jgi:hypothetical protein
MKYEAALPVLREHYRRESSNTPVGYASGWSIEQMTGEQVAAPTQETQGLSTWFLIPVGRKSNVATYPGFAGSERESTLGETRGGNGETP